MDDDKQNVQAEQNPQAREKKSHAERIVAAVGFGIAIALFGLFAAMSAVFLCTPGYYERIGAPGGLFAFLNTSLGLGVMLFCLIDVSAIAVAFFVIAKRADKRALKINALKKSAQALSGVNLRYDNIQEITAVLDVLDMVTGEAEIDRKVAETRLDNFLKASSLSLPQGPETAAILDSLPAPDTPASLAAALSAGATLRQAEDGQTLILTTISGEKHILLTPVQTADGVILCRQGVRIRSDIAPNIEEIGLTSIPTAPEFFEGLPLEKDVEYPELPQPGVALGPAELLSRGLPGEASNLLAEAVLSAPQKAGERQPAPTLRLGGTIRQIPPVSKSPASSPAATSAPVAESRPQVDARTDFLRFREQSDKAAIEQTEKLNDLLADVAPLSREERERLERYKSDNAKSKKAKPSKQALPEQAAKRKEAARRKKAEHEAFLAALSPEDRALYLAEQKLSRSRAAAIRKLNRIAADRKLLEKLDKDKQ